VFNVLLFKTSALRFSSLLHIQGKYCSAIVSYAGRYLTQ
jgi:hypothetical protein